MCRDYWRCARVRFVVAFGLGGRIGVGVVLLLDLRLLISFLSGNGSMTDFLKFNQLRL